MKKLIRRFLMTVLFFAALLTTMHTISGVEARDLNIWDYRNKTVQEESFLQHIKKKFLLREKKLLTVNPTAKKISSQSIAMPKSLDEAFNWERYPSKTVVATGYTAGIESTGKTEGHPEYGITYSGVRVKRDLYSTIAADLTVFPIGTILYIPGYGYGVVADKGGAIKGHKIDLYYETVKDVYEEWGKKKVDVYILKRGNGTISEEELKKLNEDETMQVFRKQIIKG